MKRAIHIFNPETDYALAVGDNPYSPPAKVERMKCEMALLPQCFANEGDVIIVPENFDHCNHSDEIARLAIDHVKVCRLSGIAEVIRLGGVENFEIKPWGWNHSLRRQLISLGVPPELLKTPGEIDTIRQLSHRAWANDFRNYLRKSPVCKTLFRFPLIKECKSDIEALDFAATHGRVYFKAPWSSSGRGVVPSGSLEPKLLSEWLHGTIKRQGSVMAETELTKTLDFASEWVCSEGRADFAGLSVFRTTRNGRYQGNVEDSQHNLVSLIRRLVPQWDEEVIEVQRKAIATLIADKYSGPLGIDMLATDCGHVYPCVEINFRMTMGMAAACKTKTE